tara:strand:- start:227 stop:724 length:498 start_codon:yes stop_codon:yes gene_type:complete
LNLSQAALFKRFGTKQELMKAALIPAVVPGFVAEVAAGPDLERPLDQQIRSIARSVVVFFRGMVPCVMVLKAAGVDFHQILDRFDEPPPVLARRLLSAYFARAMAAGLVRPSDPLAVASLFLGAFHINSFISHVVDKGMSEDDLFAFSDAVVDVLWHGIAPLEAQ